MITLFQASELQAKENKMAMVCWSRMVWPSYVRPFLVLPVRLPRSWPWPGYKQEAALLYSPGTYKNIHWFINLKYTKLQKKAEHFSHVTRTPHYNKFHWGQKYNSKKRGGGGAKIWISNLIYTTALIKY